MSAHTPGPWKAVPVDGEWSVRTLSPFAPTGQTVVHIGPDCVSERNRPVCSGEAVANARLIAAAPDLLAALETFLAWYETAALPREQIVGLAARAGEARAAIARARGGQ